MKKVCPYCLGTSYVCIESYPRYRVESYYVSGREEPFYELDEDYCEYDNSCPPIMIYCPECENKYENCTTVEEAWELMKEVEK